MHIIVVQSSNGARAHIGPFKTQDEADSWAKQFDSDLWWHVELQQPNAKHILYTLLCVGQ